LVCLFGEKRPSKIKGFVEVYLNSLFVCTSLCLILITKLSDYFFEQNFVIPNLSGRELPISQGLWFAERHYRTWYDILKATQSEIKNNRPAFDNA